MRRMVYIPNHREGDDQKNQVRDAGGGKTGWRLDNVMHHRQGQGAPDVYFSGSRNSCLIASCYTVHVLSRGHRK